MTDADSKTFGVEMALLAEVYGEQLSTPRIRAYFQALSDYELVDVRAAMRQAIRTCRFFPRPVELLDAMDAKQRALALRSREQRALAEPKELTEEEWQGIEAAMAQFKTVVSRDLWMLFYPRELVPVSEAEQAEHERSKRETLQAFRQDLEDLEAAAAIAPVSPNSAASSSAPCCSAGRVHHRRRSPDLGDEISAYHVKLTCVTSLPRHTAAFAVVRKPVAARLIFLALLDARHEHLIDARTRSPRQADQ